MSLNNLAIGALMFICAAAQAEDAKCPSYQGQNPLSTVIVYDGPPEEKADLMPDVSRGSGDHAYASWEVGYIFDSGRKLFLVCRFHGLPDAKAVTVKVKKKVRSCVFRTYGRGKPAELTCK